MEVDSLGENVFFLLLLSLIHIFYDDMGSIGFINTDFVKKMEAIGIHCRVFNPTFPDRKSTRLNSSHVKRPRMPSSA